MKTGCSFLISFLTTYLINHQFWIVQLLLLKHPVFVSSFSLLSSSFLHLNTKSHKKSNSNIYRRCTFSMRISNECNSETDDKTIATEKRHTKCTHFETKKLSIMYKRMLSRRSSLLCLFGSLSILTMPLSMSSAMETLSKSSRKIAFTFPNSNSASSNNNENNNNNNNNNSMNKNNNKDILSDGSTYGFEDGTIFSMTSMKPTPTVAYKALSIDISNYDDIKVPVALWFKPDNNDSSKNKLREENYDDNDESSSERNNSFEMSNGKKKLIMDFPSVSMSIPSLTSTSSTDPVDSRLLSSKSSPTTSNTSIGNIQHTAVYHHRISVKKIGSLLAKLDFIPKFISKDFELQPTATNCQIINGNDQSLPSDSTKPVIILAHGFLGSRFDLSHLAEQLALEGFMVFSPEYPESLSSSYDSNKYKASDSNDFIDKLDRTTINKQLINVIESDLKLKPKSYGIIGHSLGTGTVMTTGDDSWTRVCIAGPPVRRDNVPVNGQTLAIVSTNDGAVTLNRIASMIPESFVQLDESTLFQSDNTVDRLPPKSILILDRDDAPNHISFLAGNVNDSMVSFLSPLLPIAQALNIPVLDFDKYKESRDSEATAKVVIPLVISFMKQFML